MTDNYQVHVGWPPDLRKQHDEAWQVAVKGGLICGALIVLLGCAQSCDAPATHPAPSRETAPSSDLPDCESIVEWLELTSSSIDCGP